MRRPPLCCEAHENGGHDLGGRPGRDGLDGRDNADHELRKQHRDSSGPLSRVRRFLHLPLNSSGPQPSSSSASTSTRRKITSLCLEDPYPSDLHPFKESINISENNSSCRDSSDNSSDLRPELLRNRSQLVAFRIEAENVIGRSLDDLMEEGLGGQGQGEGVPALVHALCDHMLQHGIDYETLVSDRWCAQEVRAAIVGVSFDCKGEELDVKAFKACTQLQSDNGSVENTLTAALLRLFLEDLPQPQLDQHAVKDLKNVFKDFDVRVGVYNDARRVLQRRLSGHTLTLLRYLAIFLNQVAKQHDQCLSSPESLGPLLARVIFNEGADHFGFNPTYGTDTTSTRGISIFVAEILIRNSDRIFASQEEDETGFSSDALSSPGESPARQGDNDDESSTTTEDTDEFRSPPVSPTKGALKSCTANDKGRATAELPDADGYRPKKSNFSKTSYLPSITDLLSSPDESCLKDEVQRSSRHDYAKDHRSYNTDQTDGLLNQSNSDASSEAEDPLPSSPNGEVKCPHEERRSSERFSFGRGGGGSSGDGKDGKKMKKTRKRKHSKERSHRATSSGEEEDDLDRNGDESFVCLLVDNNTSADTPQPFDPSPASDPVNLTISSPPVIDEYLGGNCEGSNERGWVSDLLDSSEPVTSDRTWGFDSEVARDNWRRTAHHYSREDDEPTASPQYYNPTPSSSRKKSQDGDTTGRTPQSTIKVLQKNVNSIKKKIKKFEEDFESAFGYRPSHSEKMKHKDVKKHMSELSRTRKELKQLKEDVSNMISSQAVTGFPMSFLRSQEPTSPVIPSPITPGGAKDTLRQVLDHLHEKRKDSHRPQELIEMSFNEMHDEKTSLQRALLYYESMHGRPSSKEERDLARPLYDRYRLVKRTIARTSSRLKENLIELAPILEHEAMDFTLASPIHRGSYEEEECQNPLDTTINRDTLQSDYPSSPKEVEEEDDDSLMGSPIPSPNSGLSSPTTPISLGDLHALPIHQLKDRKREAKDEKKRLRRLLREFEEGFESQNGRKLQKEDRGPMEGTYAEYKHAKAKLRLLEALLSKHDSVRV